MTARGCNNWGAICCVVPRIPTEGVPLHKRPISFAQLRTVPQQCSWGAQRLVRERSLDQRSHAACARALVLVAVADAQGLRFYAERSLCERVSMAPAVVRQAHQALIQCGLVAYERPRSQVLALGGDARDLHAPP